MLHSNKKVLKSTKKTIKENKHTHPEWLHSRRSSMSERYYDSFKSLKNVLIDSNLNRKAYRKLI